MLQKILWIKIGETVVIAIAKTNLSMTLPGAEEISNWGVVRLFYPSVTGHKLPENLDIWVVLYSFEINVRPLVKETLLTVDIRLLQETL